MQQWLTSNLKLTLGAGLLFPAAIVLPAAARNYQTIAPPTQMETDVTQSGARSYHFIQLDVPGGFCTTAGAINDRRLASVNYSHDAQCQSLGAC